MILLLVALSVLHQDFWWWDDASVVFGFIPIGLAWHAGISLAAGLVWWLAVVFCWPQGLDADDPVAPASAATRADDRPGQEGLA